MPKLPAGLKHTVWSLLDAASYPIIYVALTPVLIRHMGPVIFGFWMVLNTLTVVLQLFNLNLGYTAMRHIAGERASGNTSLVRDIINSLLGITLFQLCGIMAIGAILTLIIAWTGWLGDYGHSIRYGSLCFLLASLLGGLKFFEQIFQNIIKSYERFREAAILNMIFRIGMLCTTLAAAILFPKMIVVVMLANIAFSLAYLALQYAYIHRILPFYKIAGVAEGGIHKRLLRYSMWPWLQMIVVVLTFQADRFWVSGYAGLKEVSAYAIVATMFNHIHLIFMAMIAWISPRIIAMHATGQDPSREYAAIRSLLTVISIGSLLLFYALSPLLFRLWLGADMYLQLEGYVQAFTGFELAFVHTIMPVFYLNGTGRERQATWITIACCAACYVLMLVGLLVLGSPVALVQGMAIGACLIIPVFNAAANYWIFGKRHAWKALPELIPVFAAIGIINVSSTLTAILLALGGGWTLWKYYLVHLSNRNVWKQVLGV